MRALHSYGQASDLGLATTLRNRETTDTSVWGSQVDLRMPEDPQERLKHRMAQMSMISDIDREAASAALRLAYHDVTRNGILCAASSFTKPQEGGV